MTNYSSLLVIVILCLLSSAAAFEKVVTCPPQADYVPCSCTEESSGAIYVNCNNRNMTDSMASSVLQAFLNTIGISPVFYLDFAYNQLTKVPDEVRLFDKIQNVNLHWNKIQSIPSNAFLFSKSFRNHLTLQNNQISAIGAGAFQGFYDETATIDFRFNSLSRFESSVFQSVLEQMYPFNGYPFSYIWMSQNPIDCNSDPCHLAWLIRDNQRLLKNVHDGQCSNGTKLENLLPTTICPVTDTTSPLPTSASTPTVTTTASSLPPTTTATNTPKPQSTEQQTSTTSLPPTTTSTVTTTTTVGPFVCPAPNGNFANPLSCTSYYMCRNNLPNLINCPPGFVFDTVYGSCDYPSNVEGDCHQ